MNVSDVSLVSVFQVYTMICLHHPYSHPHSIVTVTDTVHVLSLRTVSFFSVRTSTLGVLGHRRAERIAVWKLESQRWRG